MSPKPRPLRDVPAQVAAQVPAQGTTEDSTAAEPPVADTSTVGVGTPTDRAEPRTSQPSSAPPTPTPIAIGIPPPLTEPVDHETKPSKSGTKLSALDLALVVVFWGGLGLVFMLASTTRRDWLLDNWMPLAVGLTAVIAVFAMLLTTGWAKARGASTRAAVLLLFGYPVLVMLLASVFFVLPATQQLIAMRGVVLVTLSVTPALLWWLFLATQRASLLNEFVASLQRLGLLDAWCIGGRIETDRSRAIRISGYLQRFEATYGRMPKAIHDNIINNSAEPYSEEDARESVPLATAAVPVFLSIVVFSIGWLLTLPPIESFPTDSETSPRWLLALTPNATPVTMTFLGAYFFSLQLLFRRYVRGDLRGSAYVAVVLRVVLAMIGIWVIEATGSMSGWQSRSELLLLAFIVGVFPVVVWQVIRNVGTSLFQVVVPTLKSGMPLAELDGLTVWHESRLEEEDIENVPNMATADIVDLLVNTRFPANRVIDWVDQAILLTQLGSSQAARREHASARHLLARHGIRTASALLKAAQDARDGRRMDEFTAILADEKGVSAMPSLLAAVRTSNNLALVMRWRGLEAI